jgi:hypothetical protein
MPITLDGTSGITTPMYNGSITANAVTPSVSMKNRIINGQMVIDQRNAGASVTASTTGAQGYTLDRWAYQASQASKFTVQQNAGSVTPPAGFTNYLGVTSSATTSVGSSDYFLIDQCVEGLNVADLGWGTANAKTVTLSFQVYSSLTGTFGGAILNSGASRSYPFTYTISSANTWTTISVTIAGDTSGTWLKTNGIGMFISFSLGMGSTYSGTAGSWSGSALYSATGATSVVGTNGATLFLTGVQLEVGSTATSFDYRPYGTELNLCQRYCYLLSAASNGNCQFGFNYTFDATTAFAYITYPITMRSSPTLTTAGTFNVNQTTSGGYSGKSVSAVSINQACETGCTLQATISGGTSGGVGTFSANNNTASRLIFSAEL